MIRTQIQLTEGQYEKLKRLAQARGVSMAELVREGIDLFLGRADIDDREELKRRALRAAGRFRSGMSNLSEKHDDYLADAFSQ